MRRPTRRLAAALLLALLACTGDEPESPASWTVTAGDRYTIDLAGPGWTLWLDRQASWEDDPLFAPPVDVADVPVNAPTGGWASLTSRRAGERDTAAVSVPGTVEEHFWEANGGDYQGVSWWWCRFELPDDVPDGELKRRIRLRLEAVRLRAEVFLNEELVGYDVVGNTPFELDATEAARSGENLLAVRVTDPGGNFDWKDHEAHTWGTHTIPASHGFGGVTGPVRVELVAPVHVADLFVENTPAIDAVQVHTTVRNDTGAEVTAELSSTLDGPDGQLARIARTDLLLGPGETTFTHTITVDEAARWSLDSPTLHTLTARVDVSGGGYDGTARRFGFRWFDLDGIGEDAVFRLNGERIVLRSAISWGFWPVTGMVPSPELARRQVQAAKALGLNMLNHHRTIAAPGLLDLHDELGLLAYCEPGGYAAVGGDALCEALAREKLLRMVRRDRSRPSVVIWNMINEELADPNEADRRDIVDAHGLDPSRVITFTSAWAEDGQDATKLHMRPGDETLHESGWWDYHNAPGPGVWQDAFYKGPADYRRFSDNRGEIVFWGEEGAIASPPRLAAMHAARDEARPGWDGVDYEAWYQAYDRFLDDKGWRAWFADVDAMTSALGDVAYEYQARTIEHVRMGDVADGYVVNGWDGEKLENHSGIVDAMRNAKGDARILAEANAPRRLVIRPHASVLHAGEWVSPSMQTATAILADVHLINEAGWSGPHELMLTLLGPQGATVASRRADVSLGGGERFGELLAADVSLTAELASGEYRLRAELRPPNAVGRGGPAILVAEAELLVVDWRSKALPARLAVLEQSHAMRRWFAQAGKGEPQVFHADLDPLDVVVIGDWDPEPRVVIPTGALGCSVDGERRAGLRASYFRGDAFDEVALERVDERIEFEWSRSGPDESVGREDYRVRWEGELTAPEGGKYLLHTLSDDGVRLSLDGRMLIDHWEGHPPSWDRSEPVALEGGRAYKLKVEYRQTDGAATVRLAWTTPQRRARAAALLEDLVVRAQVDGTSVLFLDRADVWAGMLAERGHVEYAGRLEHGEYWMGGGFLVRDHPIFSGLPVDGAMGSPYADLVRYGATRFGLLLSGEETIVATVSDHQPMVATAMGIVPAGRGHLLLSTLDIPANLNRQTPSGEVVRRLFAGLLGWAAR